MTLQIGRFFVRKRLGGGGFGEVFLAEDPSIGRQVAIKVFRPKDENLIAFATSSNTEGLNILRTRFLNEARILAQLHDEPHVVDVLEFGELLDGTPYYVMPYLPNSLAEEFGKDVFDANALAELAESERPRALPIALALDAVEQTLKGLAAAHSQGLVHRDIKPGNLMRSEKGLLRIVDFGIAKAPDTQHSTVSHLGMGSRNYMAPEQRESAKHVDARADIYSTAVVAYRSLTGKLPVGRFADPNVAVPALGTAMNSLLLRMLAQDKADRPNNATEALGLFQQARKLVGQQDTGEYSGTWAGEQGAYEPRDELKPLRAVIAAQVSKTGFIPASDMKALRAMAVVADLDDADLSRLIVETLAPDKTLQARSKLGDLVRQEVARAGENVNAVSIGVYRGAAEAAGWSTAEFSAVVQAARADLSGSATDANAGRPSPHPVAAQPIVDGPLSSASSVGSSTNGHSRTFAAGLTSRLPFALATLLLLGGAAWGVLEWRQAQLSAEARERAHSAASEGDDAAWEQATLADTDEGYRNYLQHWPRGGNAVEAKARMEQLSAAQREAERIKAVQRDLNALGYRVSESGEADSRTVEAIRQFEQAQRLVVTGTPDALLAQALQDELGRRDEAAWVAATRADTEAAYQDYQRMHPAGRYVGELAGRIAQAKHQEAARQEAARLANAQRESDEDRRVQESRIADERRKAQEARAAEDSAWLVATTQNTEVAYEAYRLSYPSGRYLAELPQRIQTAREQARRDEEQSRARTLTGAATTPDRLPVDDGWAPANRQMINRVSGTAIRLRAHPEAMDVARRIAVRLERLQMRVRIEEDGALRENADILYFDPTQTAAAEVVRGAVRGIVSPKLLPGRNEMTLIIQNSGGRP